MGTRGMLFLFLMRPSMLMCGRQDIEGKTGRTRHQPVKDADYCVRPNRIDSVRATCTD
jgi:hypothetical protein